MKRIYEWVKEHYVLISVLILCVSIVPFVVISYYSRPCTDDYNFSINMIRMVEKGHVTPFSVLKTAFETDMSFYKTWNGLYMSGFLQSMQPGAYLGERNYYVGTLVLMAYMLWGINYFVRTMIKAFDLKIKPLLPTMFLFAFFIHGMINPCQGLYWFCGAYDYIPFIILTMVIISTILKYYYSEEKNCSKYIVLTVILSLINSGGNHITAFLNILILFVMSLVCIFKKKKYGILITFAAAVIGFLFVVFAPGTLVRMDQFEKRSVFVTVSETFYKVIFLSLSKDYLLNPRFILYVIVLVLFATMIKDNERIRNIHLNPIFFFFILAMFECAMLAVPYHAMGSFGAGRIKNIIWMGYMTMVGILIIYTVIWASKKIHFVDELLSKIQAWDKRFIAIIFCLLLVLFSRNMYSVIGELKDGTAKTFAQQYEERYELMKEYRESGKLVEVDPLIESKNLKFDDISTDLNDWRNQSWSEYYLVDTVVKQ